MLRNSKQAGTDLVLFSETTGCFLAEVENERVAKKLFAKVPYSIIGRTIKTKQIRVNHGSKNLCDLPLSILKEKWQKPMEEIFH